MKKLRKLILALDGIETPELVLEKINETLSAPLGMPDTISHFKFNDALHMEGFKAILPVIINSYTEISIFWDLKLPDTNGTDSWILSRYLEYMRPGDILTVTSDTSLRAFREIRQVIPAGVKITIVSVKTDTDRAECKTRRGMSPEMAILNDARNLLEFDPTAFDAVICSPKELRFLIRNLPLNIKFFVPGVRDSWMTAGQQSKDRVAGIKSVLDNGASGAVLGAQLMKGNPDEGISALESRKLTLVEMGRTRGADDPVNGTEAFLDVLKKCNGYYESPVDENGKYLGPLVAYAGTYETLEGLKNKVGFIYFNFARAESKYDVRTLFGNEMGRKIAEYLNADDSIPACHKVLGAPMGGILLSGAVGGYLSCETIFAEKKTITPANKEKGIKEVSELVIDRHEIFPGENVFIIEDVCNNFSTTEKLKAEIEKHGGHLLGIACAVNRSGETEWKGLPVISALLAPTDQYKQGDEEVAELVAKGEIVWQPKPEWPTLKAAMSVRDAEKEE